MTSRKTKAAEFQDVGYDIHVTGRQLAITQSMKDYALEKVAKLEKFSDRIQDVQITMDVQRFDHKVEISLRFDNVKIVSKVTTTDMYASIDLAVRKIEAQMIKYRGKIKNHHAKGIKAIDMNVNVIRPHLEDEVKEINSEIEEESMDDLVERYRPHKVVARETKPLKTLTVDEAIMKMELSDDIFMIFRSEDDNKIKVIYRRHDGNFGIIEP
jgi:putative sigma-54 modulation protein